MGSYQEIFNIVLKREAALLGRSIVKPLFHDFGIKIDDSFSVSHDNDLSVEKLEEIVNRFKDSFGYIAILVIKLPIKRIAARNKLVLPGNIF